MGPVGEDWMICGGRSGAGVDTANICFCFTKANNMNIRLIIPSLCVYSEHASNVPFSYLECTKKFFF